MAISDMVKTSVHGSIVLSDGTGTPITHTELYDLGDFALNLNGASGGKLNAAVHHFRRGNYVSSSYGDRAVPTMSFTAYHTGTAGSTPGSIADWVLRRTPYASTVSTLGSGRVWACKVVITWEGTDFGDSADGTITLNNVVLRLDSFAEQMDGNRFSISGDVLGAIEGDLSCSEI
jgi:hypothetical protein